MRCGDEFSAVDTRLGQTCSLPCESIWEDTALRALAAVEKWSAENVVPIPQPAPLDDDIPMVW